MRPRFMAVIFMLAMPVLFSSCEGRKDYTVIKDTSFEWLEETSWREHYERRFPFDGNVRILSKDKPEMTDDEKFALRNGMKIVRALKEHRRENGSWPKSLSELVPRHLPEIPGTGLTGFWESREFHYEYPTVMFEGDVFELHFSGGFEDFYWYETGNFWEFEYD